MAINAAEEETLETLKKWWEENGKQLVAAIVIVAAGLAVGTFGKASSWLRKVPHPIFTKKYSS